MTMPNPSPHRDDGRERVLARTCARCAATFEPSRRHQVFCRPSCRMAAFKTKREPDRRMQTFGLYET